MNQRVENTRRADEYKSLKVTRYEQVTSLLSALLILVGFFVSILLLIWLTHQLVFTKATTKIVLVEEDPSARGDHAEGYQRDMEEPGLEELPELETPRMEALLEAVTDVVSNRFAALDTRQTEARLTSRGRELGDIREEGPIGDEDGDADVIPPWERWRIKYSTDDIWDYARQLDWFDIELGAVGGGIPHVDYAKNLSQPSPDRRQGRGDDEKRIYFTQREGKLKDFDRRLLHQAGIGVDRRVILQFYPAELEDVLALLEKQRAESERVTSARQYKTTVFKVVKIGGDYAFEVEDMRFRTPPR